MSNSNLPGAIASSAGGIFSSIFSGISAKRSQERQMEFNSVESQKNRDWQTQMSNTAYQRSSKDMKEAGLNPMMVYGKGGASGASTPSGSSATSSAPIPDMSGIVKGISHGISTAVEMMAKRKEVEKKDEEIKLLKSRTTAQDLQNQITEINIPVHQANKSLEQMVAEYSKEFAKLESIQKYLSPQLKDTAFMLYAPAEEISKVREQVKEKAELLLDTAKKQSKSLYNKLKTNPLIQSITKPHQEAFNWAKKKFNNWRKKK